MQRLVILGLLAASAFGYNYKTFWFTTKVDHFGYSNNDTFQLRVLYNEDHFDLNNPGPIFFYTGNEGDIEMFTNNTGLMWDWAAEFKALLIFAEHRYYGQTLPYGKKSFTDPKYYGYLTVDQALADYADLLATVKKTWAGTANSKIVAFGGSYGGMLTAWMRMKYPWIIDAALAASAPILQFQDITPCESYNQVVTRAFKVESDQCVDNIRKSWSIIDKLGKSGAEGASRLGRIFKICQAITLQNYTAVRDWLSDTYSNLAMMNYPYSTNFMKKVPGHPVRVACSYLNKTFASDDELLVGIYQAINVFQNFSGSTKCNDLSDSDGASLGIDGWSIQTCNEMVMPMCGDGKTDMFYKYDFNFTDYRGNCESTYKITPDLYKAATMFGGKDISAASNIIFSNGDVDPWSSGGVLVDLSASLPVVIIKGGAHHYDLRASDPQDTPEVIAARNVEKEYIKKWIGSF